VVPMQEPAPARHARSTVRSAPAPRSAATAFRATAGARSFRGERLARSGRLAHAVGPAQEHCGRSDAVLAQRLGDAKCTSISKGFSYLQSKTYGRTLRGWRRAGCRRARACDGRSAAAEARCSPPSVAPHELMSSTGGTRPSDRGPSSIAKKAGAGSTGRLVRCGAPRFPDCRHLRRFTRRAAQSLRSCPEWGHSRRGSERRASEPSPARS
jgi:hypothetical protein